MFYRKKGKNSLYVIIYVDDGLIVGNSEKEIQDFLRQLGEEFKITLGSLKNFLGMQIIYHSGGSISINQKDYTTRILEQYGMDECNAVSTPATREELNNKEELKEEIPFRHWKFNVSNDSHTA